MPERVLFHLRQRCAHFNVATTSVRTLCLNLQKLWLDPEEKDLAALNAYITEMLKIEKGETLIELGLDNVPGTLKVSFYPSTKPT